MITEDQLDKIRLAWRLRPDTQPAREFDEQTGAELKCSASTIGRGRRKLGLRIKARATQPYLLAKGSSRSW